MSRYGLVLATSEGFTGAYRRSGHTISMTAIAGEGTAMQRDYDASYKVFHADLDPPEKIGTSAGKRAAAALDPRKLETMRVPVIFDRRVATTLVGHAVSALNGASVARKTSFLRDRLGERLFPAMVRIHDDPLKPRALRSRPFDDEGVRSRALDIVSGGVLNSLLLDCATARELGKETTGHASRGAGSAPSPSPTNITLDAGTRSPADMMRDLGKGLLVTQLIGSGANLVTGDYSRGCWGFWFENGEIAYPVAEITIAGHLIEMFAALEPADDLEFKYASNAPSCFAGEMTLAGR